ncbi:MAG: hypothetical protein LBG70_03095, partial [Bifidobacteriaceae bacterium]|nr:hypothetical protein [Bifidobacteriaceae bacterium]
NSTWQSQAFAFAAEPENSSPQAERLDGDTHASPQQAELTGQAENLSQQQVPVRHYGVTGQAGNPAWEIGVADALASTDAGVLGSIKLNLQMVEPAGG